MHISKKKVLILVEATAAVLVGLIHTGAGIILTYTIAFIHIRFDQETPSQPRMVQVCHRCPLLPKRQDEEDPN